ncbi:MAG: bacillithiol biosynthesis BshC, partial [Cyclobacteriaceae bacterium]|nr:bacillithiol biosynthesis BshC [Cyclobacteriaceae bacterium]
NVVLRPVYQEVILPNLAYIGGPAEVAYWLQLKDVFDHYEIPFPVLFPRLFGMIISKTIAKKMDKLQLDQKAVFKDFSVLKEELLYKDTEPVHDLTGQIGEIEKIFKSIKDKVGTLDKSLEGFVMSEFKKAEKGVENIQKRLKKAEEQKEEVSIKQLEGILEKLFPNGNPQEREDNFLNFYINNPYFIHELIELLDPFKLSYNILTEDA